MAVAVRESSSKHAQTGGNGPRLTVVQAVQRNLPLALAPIVVLVIAALVVAKLRDPVYSSDAQLNVGGVTLTVQSIPGYSVAVAQLAVAYSRSVDATQVVNRVSRKTGMPAADVMKNMAATPVEQTPVIRIHATGKTPQEAQLLANSTGDALVAYASTLQSANPDTPRLLSRYVSDSRRLRAASAAVAKARSDTDRQRAQAAADLAILQQRTDALLYQQSVAGDSATGLVRKLAPASIPKSDRSAFFQRLLLAALIAGGLIGVGLAVAQAHSQGRRRIAQP